MEIFNPAHCQSLRGHRSDSSSDTPEAILPTVGGVARSVDFFAEDLRRRGHDVLVVAPSFSETAEAEPHILRVPAIQNFNASDFSVRIPVPFLIDQEIDAFEPDLIHSHHPFLLGDAALRAARRRKPPLLFTYHTQYEKYTHYVPLDSESLKRFVINLATGYANLCSSVVAPSRSIARIIQRRGVETSVAVISTGVDVDFFSKGDGDTFRIARDISREAFVVGTCSRLAPEKNLVYLSRAAAGYLKTDPDARFLVLGEGPSEKEFSKEIETFQKSGEMAAQWRIEVRRTAKELSRDNCARQMEALYQSVLASDLTVGDEGEDDLISWAKLLEGIKAEWELLTEKTTAAVKSLQTE